MVKTTVRRETKGRINGKKTGQEAQPGMRQARTHNDVDDDDNDLNDNDDDNDESPQPSRPALTFPCPTAAELLCLIERREISQGRFPWAVTR